jgi:hypothetical protein
MRSRLRRWARFIASSAFAAPGACCRPATPSLNPEALIFSFGGTFNAASFTRVAGVGPSTPAFDGVTPTRFGFAAGNNMSATLTQHYDNFRLTVAAAPRSAGIAPISTFSEWSMLALISGPAAIALLTIRRRRLT